MLALNDRLDDARRRIGKMCSEGRPPRMTIPVQYDDDDFYISTTLADAQATIADLQGRLEAAQNKQTALEKSVRNLTEFYDKYNGTPCEQIRHQQEVEQLQQHVARLEGDVRGRESRIEALRKELARVMVDRQALQADHARVLGLMQELPNWKDLTLVPDNNQGRVLWTDESGCTSTIAVFSRLAHANKFIDLVNYRASLPAQPAQGVRSER